MKFEFETLGKILVVKISGELDHHNAAPLREATDRELLPASESLSVLQKTLKVR